MSRIAKFAAGLGALMVVLALAFNLLMPRTFTVGGFSAGLLEREDYRELSATETAALFAESRISEELQLRVGTVEVCGAVEADDSTNLVVCGATGIARTEADRVADLVALADAIMRDQTGGGAVTIAASDSSLAEHRGTLISDGVTVLDFVGFQKIGSEDVPGLFIERKGVVEWLGLATGTDGEYVIWATGSTREQVEARLHR
jgi:hypothetical protein